MKVLSNETMAIFEYGRTRRLLWLARDALGCNGMHWRCGNASFRVNVGTVLLKELQWYALEMWQCKHACGANATHGLPRNNRDKRNAVKRLLDLSKWQKKIASNYEIAKQCGVTEHLVRIIRSELANDHPDHPYATKSQKPTNPPVEPAQTENEERIRTPENDTEKRETVEQFFADFPGSEELSNREIAKLQWHALEMWQWNSVKVTVVTSLATTSSRGKLVSLSKVVTMLQWYALEMWQ